MGTLTLSKKIKVIIIERVIKGFVGANGWAASWSRFPDEAVCQLTFS